MIEGGGGECGGVGGAIPATVLAGGRTILPPTNHNYCIYSKYAGFILSLLYLSINLNKLVLLPAEVPLTDGLVANSVDQKCGIRSWSTFFLTHSVQIFRVSTVFIFNINLKSIQTQISLRISQFCYVHLADILY